MSISSNPSTYLNESTVPCNNQTNVDNNRIACTCTVDGHESHQTIPTLMTTQAENALRNDDANNVIHSVTFYNNIDAYGSHNDKSPAFKHIFNNKMFMGGGFIQSSYVGGLALQRGRSGNNCVRSMYFIIFFVDFWFLHFVYDFFALIITLLVTKFIILLIWSLT